MQADSIKIECEDDGFHLVIDGYDPSGKYRVAEFNFNIHSCAEALHEQVNLIIGGWLAEGESAKRCRWEDRDGCAVGGGYAASGHFNPTSGEYESTDPKHPEFHSIHTDHYDNREKV